MRRGGAGATVPLLECKRWQGRRGAARPDLLARITPPGQPGFAPETADRAAAARQPPRRGRGENYQDNPVRLTSRVLTASPIVRRKTMALTPFRQRWSMRHVRGPVKNNFSRAAV